jgi:hypothetical protein
MLEAGLIVTDYTDLSFVQGRARRNGQTYDNVAGSGLDDDGTSDELRR